MGRNKIEHRDPLLRKFLAVLAANLKDVREKEKLSQQELATRAKLASSTVSEIESKRAVDLRLSTITALARELDVDVLWLLKSRD